MNTFFEIDTSQTETEIYITREIIDDFWDQLTGSNQSLSSISAKQIFLDEFERAATGKINDTGLFYRTNGWKIIVKKNILKVMILTPALYGILSYLGLDTSISSIVLPSIIPILFDIENIRLSKKEEEILINLPLKNSKEEYQNAKQLYKSLPQSIKEQVDELDFLDFLEKLCDGGMATESIKGKYRVLKKDSRKFKITID